MASGATIHFGTLVRDVEFDRPALVLSTGSTIAADLVIAADGTNSHVRMVMHPKSKPFLTGNVTLQANIARSVIFDDNDEYTKRLYEDPATQLYLGEDVFSFTSVAPNQNI